MAARSLVSVVDDDESVRESLPGLLKELGYAVETFASAEDFLMSEILGRTGCLILDIAMPAMSGPELLVELTRRGVRIPTILITGDTDASVRKRMLSLGAVECLFKPFGEGALIDALDRALRVN